MIRVAIDSTILIYAEFEPEPEKGTRSADLILRAAHDGVISAQVLGEFLRFAERRMPAAFDDAIRQALLYQAVFLTPPTTDAIINAASALARANRMQLWDCVVCAGLRASWCKGAADRRHARRTDHQWPAADEPLRRRQRQTDRRLVGWLTWAWNCCLLFASASADKIASERYRGRQLLLSCRISQEVATRYKSIT